MSGSGKGPGATSSVYSNEPPAPKGLEDFLINLITPRFSIICSPDFVEGRDVEMKIIEIKTFTYRVFIALLFILPAGLVPACVESSVVLFRDDMSEGEVVVEGRG